MSAPSVERPRVIRRKIIVPDTPVGVVPRERLDGLLSQLVDAHRVVAVTATAGAGGPSAGAGPSMVAGEANSDLRRSVRIDDAL
jgi:hypothetical protein